MSIGIATMGKFNPLAVRSVVNRVVDYVEEEKPLPKISVINVEVEEVEPLIIVTDVNVEQTTMRTG